MKETVRGYLGVGLILLGAMILIYDEELGQLGKRLGRLKARAAALEKEE